MSEPANERPLGAATAFSDFASMLLARGGLALLSIASVLITTRIFGPANYGLVAYGGITAFLIFAVTSSWTSTAVSRYGRELLDAGGSMAGVTWARATIIAGPLVASVAIVIAVKVAGGFPDGFTWALVIASVAYGLALVTSDHVLYSLEASGRMQLSAAGLVGQQLAVVAALGFVLSTGEGQTPAVIIAISAAAAALYTLTFGVVIWHQALWPPVLDRPLRRRMLRFSLPVIAFSASQYAIRSIDLIVIGAYLGTAAVGQYAIAYQAYGVLQQLTIASTTVFTPLFVSLRGAGRESLVSHYFERLVPQLTLIATTAVGVAAPFVPLLVPKVFGAAYGAASDPLTLLLVATSLSFVSGLLVPIVVLHERTRDVAVINVVAAVANILGDVLLVGALGVGIIGPAVATTVAMAVVTGGYLLVAQRCVGSRTGLPLWAIVPMLPGVIVALVLGDQPAVLLGAPASVLTCAVIVALVRPIARDDAVLISKLDMPRPMKDLALTMVRIAAR